MGPVSFPVNTVRNIDNAARFVPKMPPMNALQKAAREVIVKHGSVRKAAAQVDINYALLHRISTGARKTVSPETAAKLGLEFRPAWVKLS